MRVVSYLFQSFMDQGDPRRAGYLAQLRLLAASCARLGLPFTVIADEPLADFDCFRFVPPGSLMRTVLAAEIAYMLSPRFRRDTVFVDTDILLTRAPVEGFGAWDICLTTRKSGKAPESRAPINNGAVYCRASRRDQCVAFFSEALSQCGDAWGEDQWALTRAADPIKPNSIGFRSGAVIRFVPARELNYAPRTLDDSRNRDVAVLHFKGERKRWMAEAWARIQRGLLAVGAVAASATDSFLSAAQPLSDICLLT